MDRISKELRAGDITMAYDRKSSDIIKLLRLFTKQLDRHRDMMRSKDPSCLTALIEAESGLNDVMRKLG
jgi:hypothetical protein